MELISAVNRMKNAEHIEPQVSLETIQLTHRLRMIYHVFSMIQGPQPYPICHKGLMSIPGGANLCSPVRITPCERKMSLTYDHPEQEHIPACCFGQNCIGACVTDRSTLSRFGQPLKSFRTRDTRHITDMPAGPCILCATAYMSAQSIGSKTAGSISQVYCHGSMFGPTDPEITVNAPGGPYTSVNIHTSEIGKMDVGGRVVHYVIERGLF